MARILSCLLMVVLVLPSCGGAESEPAAPATPEPTVTDAVGSDGAVAPIDVSPCDLLTADEVAAATGLAVEDVVDEPPISCVFDLGAEAGVDIFVSADDGQGRLFGPAALFTQYETLVVEGDAELVPDLGDSAIFEPGLRALVVDAGDGRYITIGVNGGFQELTEPRDTLVAIATSVLDRL